MSKEEENDDDGIIEIKAILLGETGVGKTNLANAAVDLRFDQNAKSTSNALYVQKKMIIFGKNYQLRLWDTAGQEKYRSVTKTLFSKVQGFIAMFDLTKEETFVDVKTWIELIKEECGNHIPILLVGNKSDLKDQKFISEEYIKKYTEEQNLEYIQTSSKTGDNIKKAINMICKQISEKTEDETSFNRHFSFSLDSSQHIKKRKKFLCC